MGSIVYSIPYLIVLICYALLAYWYSRTNLNKKKYLWLSAAIYLFFFGLRGFIGDDWTVYYIFFKEAPSLFDDGVWSYILYAGFEPGIKIFMIISKTFISSYHFFVFLYALINYILLIRFLRYYAINPILAIVFFVCMGGFTLQTDLMRNFMSILIFLNALPYIERRAPVQYFACILLSLLFHSSAVLFFPLYFFLHKEMPRNIFLIVLLIGNIVFLLQLPIASIVLTFIAEHFGGQYQQLALRYLMEYPGEYGLTIGWAERLLTGALIYFFYNQLIVRKKNNILFINAMCIFLVITLFFCDIAVISRRLGVLFVFAYWILWGELLNVIKLKNNRVLFCGFIYIYCFLKIAGLSSHRIWRYDNVLMGAQSYEERYLIREKYQETSE